MSSDELKYLSLDASDVAAAKVSNSSERVLFVSINPDLKTDRGHFLNYERRLRHCCEVSAIDYACFAHHDVQVELEGLRAVYSEESGHYSLIRADSMSQWKTILDPFHNDTVVALEQIVGSRSYRRIVLFVYCGSSLLASRLANLSWPSNVEIVVNSFWDFFIPADVGCGQMSRLSLQKQIRLLAMSGLHAKEIARDTGLWFDPIPNPPPLLSDMEARVELCHYGRRLETRHDNEVTVFVPGLMTIGKGRECTGALFHHVRDTASAGLHFVFRDRSGVLNVPNSLYVEVIRGDLGDGTIKECYRRADVALLPYDSTIFRVRTSGALVDCFCFGTIPLVIQGTWLADVCERYDVGMVLPDSEPATVMSALAKLRPRLVHERRRLLRGAMGYIADNSWLELLKLVIGGPAIFPYETTEVNCQHTPSESLLAEGNRLLRAGDFRTAAVVFDWLGRDAKLGIYSQNLELCSRRTGTSVESLVASNAKAPTIDASIVHDNTKS